MENNERSVVYHPPQPLPVDTGRKSVFLAGSIEMGKAREWQKEMQEALEDLSVDILNPRRPDWDPSWEPRQRNPHFAEQVEWELHGQDMVDVIAMYFDKDTKSPITLLELGLGSAKYAEKLVVCCPDAYWRKGNVEMVSAEYKVLMVETFEDLVDEVRKRIKMDEE